MLGIALLSVALFATHPTVDSIDVRKLPITELRAPHQTSRTLAIILSGDGGWADIDERVGERLRARGINVIGFDMRDYLRLGKRNPDNTAADISRLARRYLGLWQLDSIALLGYSRGSDIAPFVANRLSADMKPRLGIVGMMALLERASFTYHFSDLWSTTSGKHDIPILPELQQLRQHGVRMVCIYGKDEKESLCREAPAGMMTVIERAGKHHFDGNYDALGDIMYDAITKPKPKGKPATAQ